MILKHLFAGALLLSVATGPASPANAQCVPGQTTLTRAPSVDANGYQMTIVCGGSSGGSASSPTTTYLAPQVVNIITGSQSQQLAAPGTLTHGGDLVNNSTSNEALCFAVGVPATLSVNCLSPGTAYNFPLAPAAGQAINVIAATAGPHGSFQGY